MWQALAIYVAASLTPLLFNIALNNQSTNLSEPMVAVGVLFGLLQFLIELGFIYVAIRLTRNEPVRLIDLFSTGHILLPVLFVSLLLIPPAFLAVAFAWQQHWSLAIAAAVLLFYFYVRTSFTIVFMLDKRQSIVTAMRNSWRLTRHGQAFTQVFIFRILSQLGNLLGVLALIIGYIVLTPVLALAGVQLYRELQCSDENEPFER